MQNKKIIFKEFLLVLTTLIWGFAFVFQDIGMNYVSPFTFNFLRSIVGSLFIFLIFLILKSIKKDGNKTNYKTKDILLGGLISGVCLFLAMTSQQFGISFEGAGKSGFITALYILFVPIFGIFFKRKTNIRIIFCLLIAAVGLYFINVGPSGFGFNKGSFVLLLCAMFYGMQIIAIDYYANKCDPLLLTALQFLICAFLSLILMFVFEKPTVTNMLKAYIPVLFVGVLSSGVAFTFQTYAQKDVHPVIASLIMSLESVFAVVGAILILKETLTVYEAIGCILIFIAIMLSQIPFKKEK